MSADAYHLAGSYSPPWSAAMAGGHQLARTRLPRYIRRPRIVPPDDEPGVAPQPVPEHVDALLNHHHGVPLTREPARACPVSWSAEEHRWVFDELIAPSYLSRWWR